MSDTWGFSEKENRHLSGSASWADKSCMSFGDRIKQDWYDEAQAAINRPLFTSDPSYTGYDGDDGISFVPLFKAVLFGGTAFVSLIALAVTSFNAYEKFIGTPKELLSKTPALGALDTPNVEKSMTLIDERGTLKVGRLKKNGAFAYNTFYPKTWSNIYLKKAYPKKEIPVGSVFLYDEETDFVKDPSTGQTNIKAIFARCLEQFSYETSDAHHYDCSLYIPSSYISLDAPPFSIKPTTEDGIALDIAPPITTKTDGLEFLSINAAIPNGHRIISAGNMLLKKNND